MQNVICPERISPIARAVLNSYPLPNQPGLVGTGAENFLGVISVPSNKDIYGIKIDHNFTASRRLSGRYTYDKTFRGDSNFYANESKSTLPNCSPPRQRRLNYPDALTPTFCWKAAGSTAMRRSAHAQPRLRSDFARLCARAQLTGSTADLPSFNIGD